MHCSAIHLSFSSILAGLASAHDHADLAVPQAPLITPPPSIEEPTRTFNGHRRDVLSDIDSGFHSVASGVKSDVASAVPTWGSSGVPQFYENLPTGTQVQSSLGVSSSDLDATPTSVANYPPYANWTDQGWNVRFHGNIYKQPKLSEEKLNDLADKFLLGTSVKDLSPPEASQARNVTAEIFIVQQGHAPAPVFTLFPAPTAGASGEKGGGGAVTAPGGAQVVEHPFQVTDQGDFDEFVPIVQNGLNPGNTSTEIQRLNVYTNGSEEGNATAYLVPPEGITIISDIDDILRITKIWSPKQIIFNTFAAPYVPWDNMPAIYSNWSQHLSLGPGKPTHFHYLTTLPEQVTRNYEEFIYNTYPGGSFDTRPLNFSDVSATLSIRKYLLDRIFETYPRRKFILVGDVSNSDIMKDYPQLAHDTDQVQCILLRNTTVTDSSDDLPYDTSGFKGLNQDQYMFFNTAEDLMGLDIAGGKCWNQSVPQHLTYGYQNLPLGLHTGSGGGSGSSSSSGASPSPSQGAADKTHGGASMAVILAAGVSLGLWSWL